MGFTDKQMREAINNNEIVKDSYLKIMLACKELQEGTGCPDEDVDSFLAFLIGKWQ